MALKAGYYGLKRSLLNKVKALPGIKSIGTGLSLNSTTGELEATGATISIEANPEGEATGNLVKLGLGEDVYAVPDAAKTYQTDDATESAIVDADYIPFFDSSAASGSGAPKKSTWSNFISKIKTKITEYVTWEANSVLGVKNLYPIKINEVKATNTSGTWNENTYTINGGTVAFTVDNNEYVTSFTVNGTFSADSSMGMNAFDDNKQVPKDGSYILNGVNGGSDSTYSLKVNYKQSVSGSETGLVDIYDGDSTPKNINSAWLLKIYLIIKAGTYSDVTIRPMLRFAADSDSSYAPYAMTNKELTDAVNNKISKTIKEISSETVDLNDVTETGFYIASVAPVNSPENQSYFNMLVLNSLGGGVIRQILFASSGSSSAIYTRTYSGSTWKNWVKFTGTLIS